MKGNTRRLLPIFPLLALSSPLLAEDVDDLLALSLEQLGEVRVSIATGNPKPLTGVPAGTSLITAEEIYATGALTLDDALQSVPGLYISRSGAAYSPRYYFRGIASRFNPQALLLVNGIPMSGLFQGDRREHIPNQYSLPVKIIDRIEIIRGPGSALYGADAFAGVINVITKGPEQLNSTEASLSAGSFDTVRSTLMQPIHAGDVKAALLLSYQASKGDRDSVITSDLQTNLDNYGLTAPASNAPGAADTSFETWEARVDVQWQEFRLRAGGKRAWDIGTGAGTAGALDPTGRTVEEDGSLDLTWTNHNLLQDTQLETRLSYLRSRIRTSPSVMLLPPGGQFGTFPDGAVTFYSYAEENARFDISALYSGFDSHKVTIGTGYYWGDLFNTASYNNFAFSNSGPGLTLRPDFVQNADTDEIFLPEAQRISYHFFVQDEWQFAPAWELTSGLRYDDYDDVGSSVNPRVALVWQNSEHWTSKLLYHEAFRVPTFSELWVTSNPVAKGNPDLDPVKLYNTELIFIWQPNERVSTTLNLYRFEIKNYIDFVSEENNFTAVARNLGRIDGQGGEIEIRYSFSPQLEITGNYSYQQTREDGTHDAIGFAPTDVGYLRLQWSPKDWIISPQLLVAGERLRRFDDNRPPLKGYETFDLTVRRQISSQFSLGLIAHNLFDTDIREPSQGPDVNSTQSPVINDLPQQGRAITLEFNLEL